MISGYIPKKIRYICQESVPIEPKFNEVSESFFKTSAMPAFPVDPENEKTLETARNWASGWNRWHQTHNNEVHKEVEMDNTEIFEVQIVDLEIRDQGGRAYKAIVHGSFLVDIREDIMLEAMLIKGVRQGSFIACKFVWARIGAQMKLIRVGSSLHAEMLLAHKRKYQKNVSTKDLVPGTIYSNINSDFIFLGFTKAASLQVESRGGGYSRGLSVFSQQKYQQPTYHPMSKSRIAKHQLWLDIQPEDDTYEKILAKLKSRPYGLDLVKSRSVKTADRAPIQLPDNIVEIAREVSIKHYKVDINVEDNKLLNNFDIVTMSKYPETIKLEGIAKEIWEKLEYDK